MLPALLFAKVSAMKIYRKNEHRVQEGLFIYLQCSFSLLSYGIGVIEKYTVRHFYINLKRETNEKTK